MLNIVLFGPPGAGKGTQSQFLIDTYKLIHLSTGDILRGEIAAGTELGLNAKKLMDQGLLVPDEVVIGMIENKIKANSGAPGFIFDGFPRTVAQAEMLDKICAANSMKISGMVALQVEDEELFKRILLRGKTSGRTDDQDPALVRQRIQEYNNKTRPVADYYSGQKKFYGVEGIGSLEEVFQRIQKAISQFNS